jgi:hypothetical protein
VETKVVYGTNTKIKTVSSLKFSKYGYSFAGWKVYRDLDQKWYATDSNGNKKFVSLDEDGNLPTGYSYCLYTDGLSISKTTDSGTVHMYAQWKANTYTVKYHSSDTAAASSEETKVVYGTNTKIKTVSSLKFSNDGYSFAGWKVYRDIDQTWYAADSSGKKKFVSLDEDGNLPTGYSYSLYTDGMNISKTTGSGTVHMYAQWEK